MDCIEYVTYIYISFFFSEALAQPKKTKKRKRTTTRDVVKHSVFYVSIRYCLVTQMLFKIQHCSVYVLCSEKKNSSNDFTLNMLLQFTYSKKKRKLLKTQVIWDLTFTLEYDTRKYEASLLLCPNYSLPRAAIRLHGVYVCMYRTEEKKSPCVATSIKW